MPFFVFVWQEGPVAIAKNPRFLKNYLMLMLAASKILAHFDPDMSLTSVLDQVVDVGPVKRC